MEMLARDIDVLDRSAVFAELVGSEQLRTEPVHRWFTYKEGYSPDLLSSVIKILGLSGPLKVIDVFGGVATTALSGLVHPDVAEVRSVEYSPWARFVGSTKLRWPDLDPRRLRRLLPTALNYPVDYSLSVPDLAAFRNPKIFHHSTVASLVSARQHLARLEGAKGRETDWFLLGLGAVVEDLSGAMKDGRALRIKGERRRKASSLKDHTPAVRVQGRVKQALAGQWTAMIEDLEALADDRVTAKGTPAFHLEGDARELSRLALPDGTRAFPDGWGQLGCFSPPYLNCIDYTELYKLELWMLEFVSTQARFRDVRLGTLRSHPSVKFDERDTFAEHQDDATVRLITDMSAWLTENGARRDVGPVVRTYFEDMLVVWRAQEAALEARGVAVCVVANSTFARRDRQEDGKRIEKWRLPLLTDVLLAKLALVAGFQNVEIWKARDLRPRNVKGGSARESLVVARKS